MFQQDHFWHRVHTTSFALPLAVHSDIPHRHLLVEYACTVLALWPSFDRISSHTLLENTHPPTHTLTLSSCQLLAHGLTFGSNFFFFFFFLVGQACDIEVSKVTPTTNDARPQERNVEIVARLGCVSFSNQNQPPPVSFHAFDYMGGGGRPPSHCVRK